MTSSGGCMAIRKLLQHTKQWGERKKSAHRLIANQAAWKANHGRSGFAKPTMTASSMAVEEALGAAIRTRWLDSSRIYEGGNKMIGCLRGEDGGVGEERLEKDAMPSKLRAGEVERVPCLFGVTLPFNSAVRPTIG
ncbi:hypothetical protein AnigIFM63604_005520 [Aspergillus niger]|uniref:Uncharacterized protein n=2 Tax=Aspergillus niger TaxID=5061 RepID=A2R0C0_ASPNC|nr:hypothetical protein An12g08080 [Aspergillus niger]GLA49562.1 hypothetical protein AnigIFM63604_005520 [Aspergillus niger]CAK41258.1 hypothetical protein An12g08080 [Aspergillus niger]